MLIGIPLQTAEGETRVAVTPETAKKLKAQGHTLRMQAGAGLAASVTDAAYESAGCEITDIGCDLVLTVRSPSASELAMMKPGTGWLACSTPSTATACTAWPGPA